MIDIKHDRLPSAYAPRREELDAISKIFGAYMTLARFDDAHPFAWEASPRLSDDPTPLGYLAEAGRDAWRTLLGEGAEQFWDLMIESGEDALHVWNWYVTTHDL